MVYHVLKDGTTTTDITGRVVKLSDAENLYKLMSGIKVRGSRTDKTEKVHNQKVS